MMIGAMVGKCGRCGGAVCVDLDPGWGAGGRLACVNCGLECRPPAPVVAPAPEPAPAVALPPEPAPAPPPVMALPKLPRQRYVGRPKVAERDALIIKAVEDGVDPATVAEWYGLKGRRRVLQICAARRKEAARAAGVDLLQDGNLGWAGGEQLIFSWWGKIA